MHRAVAPMSARKISMNQTQGLKPFPSSPSLSANYLLLFIIPLLLF